MNDVKTKKHLAIIIKKLDKFLLVKITIQVMPLRILATISKTDNLFREHFQFFPVNTTSEANPLLKRKNALNKASTVMRCDIQTR